MATIGEETLLDYVSSNVVDTADIFDNTLPDSFPADKVFQEGDSIIQNITTAEIKVLPSGGTYELNDLVFKSDGDIRIIKPDGSDIERITLDGGDFPTWAG